MSKFNLIVVAYYKSNNKIKRFLACLTAHLYVLKNTVFIQIKDAKTRANLMKKQGLIKNPLCVFFDMLFCYLFLGYYPVLYSAYSFQNLSFKKRLSYMPIFENRLFALSLNNDIHTYNNKLNNYRTLKNFYNRDLLLVKTNKDYEEFVRFIEKHRIFFYKPLHSLSKAERIVNAENKNIKELFNELIKIGAFIIEELIVQCDELSSFHPSSVNTIRIIIIKNKSVPVFLSGCLKCGREKNIVDNNGIFVPIDFKTGKLLKYGIDEMGIKYSCHPDTNIKFEDFQIPRFEKIKLFALAIANELCSVKFMGMGIAISNNSISLIKLSESPYLISSEAFNDMGLKNKFRKIVLTDDL